MKKILVFAVLCLFALAGMAFADETLSVDYETYDAKGQKLHYGTDWVIVKTFSSKASATTEATKQLQEKFAFANVTVKVTGIQQMRTIAWEGRDYAGDLYSDQFPMRFDSIKNQASTIKEAEDALWDSRGDDFKTIKVTKVFSADETTSSLLAAKDEWMDVKLTTEKELCDRYGLTHAQFIGQEPITKDLDFANVIQLPEGFSPKGDIYLNFNDLLAIPKGFNPSTTDDLRLYKVAVIPEGFNPTVGGDLEMNNVLTVPEGFSPTVGKNLSLERATSAPKSFRPKVGGSLYLNSLQSLPEGWDDVTVTEELVLSSIKSIPSGVKLTVGDQLSIDNVTAVSPDLQLDMDDWSYITVPSDLILASKYCTVDKNDFCTQLVAGGANSIAVNSFKEIFGVKTASDIKAEANAVPVIDYGENYEDAKPVALERAMAALDKAYVTVRVKTEDEYGETMEDMKYKLCKSVSSNSCTTENGVKMTVEFKEFVDDGEEVDVVVKLTFEHSDSKIFDRSWPRELEEDSSSNLSLYDGVDGAIDAIIGQSFTGRTILGFAASYEERAYDRVQREKARAAGTAGAIKDAAGNAAEGLLRGLF